MSALPTPTINIQGHWTVDDLNMLPEQLRRYELWNGELIIMPAPSIVHQMVVKRLFKRFIAFDPDEQLGEYLFAPADVILTESWVVQPDILFVSAARRHIIQFQRIHGAPDLVVEVLSPRTTHEDRHNKRRIYAAAGVREYWLVDLDAQTITILTLRDKNYVEQGIFGIGDRASSLVLDGLIIVVSEIFADLPDA